MGPKSFLRFYCTHAEDEHARIGVHHSPDESTYTEAFVGHDSEWNVFPDECLPVDVNDNNDPDFYIRIINTNCAGFYM